VGDKLTWKVPYARPMAIVRALAHLRNKPLRLRWYLTSKGADLQNLRMDSGLAGLLENLREARSSVLGREALVPTRFSVFGLLNVQDTASDMDPEFARAVYGKLLRELGEDAVLEFSHSLRRSNYGEHGGDVSLVDYGQAGLDEFLKEYGEAFRAILDEVLREKHG